MCVYCGNIYKNHTSESSKASDILEAAVLGTNQELASYLTTGFWQDWGSSTRKFNLTSSGINAKNGVLTYNTTGNSIDSDGISSEKSFLVDEGFTSVEEVAYVPLDEMKAIDGFDEEIAEELRARAKDALLTRALASEEKLTRKEPAEDLLAMDGMTKQLAEQLCAIDVVTMEDLAEQAVDDLLVIDGLDADKAGQLIMTARAPWFEEETEK